MALCTRVGAPSFSSASCKREGIDDRRQHAHVIAGGAFHAALAAAQAAKNVAAADHHDHLHAEFAHLADLLGHVQDGLGIDAVAGVATEGLTAELEQNPGKLGAFGLDHKSGGARKITRIF